MIIEVNEFYNTSFGPLIINILLNQNVFNDMPLQNGYYCNYEIHSSK